MAWRQTELPKRTTSHEAGCWTGANGGSHYCLRTLLRALWDKSESAAAHLPPRRRGAFVLLDLIVSFSFVSTERSGSFFVDCIDVWIVGFGFVLDILLFLWMMRRRMCRFWWPRDFRTISFSSPLWW